jgi:hypothetical protein
VNKREREDFQRMRDALGESERQKDQLIKDLALANDHTEASLREQAKLLNALQEEANDSIRLRNALTAFMAMIDRGVKEMMAEWKP